MISALLVLFISIMPAILAMLIPIVAIVGGYYVKIKKMEFASKDASLTNKDVEMIRQISAENQSLRERIANLEQIVTSLDNDLLLFQKSNTDTLQKQIEELKKKLMQ